MYHLKTFLLSVVFILITNVGYSQSTGGKNIFSNLLQNQSFEEVDQTFTCNVQDSDLSKVNFWVGNIGNFSNADYYNTCFPIVNSFNPLDNLLGTQSPRTGDAIIGLKAGREVGLGVPGGEDNVDYIFQEIDKPLSDLLFRVFCKSGRGF